MKNYVKLLVPALLLSTTVSFAQNDTLEDEVVRENTAEYQVIEIETEDDMRILKETKATYPVIFDADDQYKLNQDRVLVDPILETTYKLDVDNDRDFEREITINYTRPRNFDYDFMLTENGLTVAYNRNGMMMKEIHMIDENNTKRKVNMLSTKGKYNIIMNNGEVYEIEVKDMK
ncbi:hypothetical protein [Kordia jejudonensis]|uniref:hypothetical protein n=1 Tax=Kordia jejudonensis TaxID=1348245 RepID=UPI0006293585|nr:hypothetical protein [Kordia jejudonensis]